MYGQRRHGIDVCTFHVRIKREYCGETGVAKLHNIGERESLTMGFFLEQLSVKLGDSNDERWKEELNKFLREEPCWLKSFIREVIVSATTRKQVCCY